MKKGSKQVIASLIVGASVGVIHGVLHYMNLTVPVVGTFVSLIAGIGAYLAVVNT